MNDPEFKKLCDSLLNLPIRPHATEIGMINILWGKLEMELDILLVALLNSDLETTSVILTNMDMRDKINSIRLIGLQKKVSDDWFEELESTLKVINNKLRPKRNRYIHDYWLSSDNSVVQLQLKTKVIKPQSRQFAINYHDAKEVELGELVTFQIKLLVPCGILRSLTQKLYQSDVPTPSDDVK